MQHIVPPPHGIAHTQTGPESPTLTPELLPETPLLLEEAPDELLEAPEELLDAPDELLDAPEELLEAPDELLDPLLDDEAVPLDEPLPDPPPLELELLVGAHSFGHCAVEHAINLSPVLRAAAVQLQPPTHSASEPPRSRQPMYVSQPVSCAQAHHSVSQWFARHSLQLWLPVVGVHAGASTPEPLDEPPDPLPEPPPEEPPVDASPPLPAENGDPPQSSATAMGSSARSTAPARIERRMTKMT